jgi:hypothetical protein
MGERSALFADILCSDYNIKVISGGCIVWHEIDWYTVEMSCLLMEKYGNFYEDAAAKAREQMKTKRL